MVFNKILTAIVNNFCLKNDQADLLYLYRLRNYGHFCISAMRNSVSGSGVHFPRESTIFPNPIILIGSILPPRFPLSLSSEIRSLIISFYPETRFEKGKIFEF